MKRFLFVFVFCALALTPARAGKVVLDSLYSKTMGATVLFNVYLPGSYSAERHYPLVFLLHGLHGTHMDWPSHLVPVADELMRSGEARKMVIVMPNAGGKDAERVQNGYFNMPGRSYEDFFFNELLPCVEERYNCGGKKSQRAIMGLSMGGGGSTVYCQRHPEVFSSCYAMSPWLDNESNEVGGRRAARNCMTITMESVREHSAIRFVREASDETVAALRSVHWFFDCGDDDFLLDQSVLIHQLMRKRKIKDELRVRDGVHNWEYWHTALRTALPFASRNFSNPR